jgi:hypothetical protein
VSLVFLISFLVSNKTKFEYSITHVGSPGLDEINGNLIALNALAGIPLKSIIGFRAPYLNYTVQTLKYLAQSGFTYDSSAAASIPVTQNGTDAYWWILSLIVHFIQFTNRD